jgi:putative GTP pyrophosphokinase
MSAVTTIIDRDALLTRHGFTREDFESTGLEWPLLEDICAHHRAASADLQTAATYISQRLQQVPAIHSLKVRVKHPEHLIAKIIRKKLEHPALSFSLQSYQDQVTDLIGLRALHLFKDEWRSIHEFVRATWDLNEEPIAYVRSGDPPALLDDFASANCAVTPHPFGYRSIHYILNFQPDKRAYLAELQVRTIFEEGWSEIDHRIRYPRHSDDVYLGTFLGIFNRLSGSADEMGTFIKELSRFVSEQADKITERDREIAHKEGDLKKAISQLKISQTEKDNLEKQIEALRKSSRSFDELSIFPTISSVVSPTHSLSSFKPEFNLTIQQKTCESCGKKYTESPLTATTLDSHCPDCRKFGTSYLTIQQKTCE